VGDEDPPVRISPVKISGPAKKAAGRRYLINVDAIEIVGAIVARYAQNDEHFDYSGKWKTVKNESAAGGSFALTKSSGASVTVSFTGTQIDWFAKVGPAYGKAQVTVDGGDPMMVDLHSADELWRQRVWSSGRMDVGSHAVKIKWTGTKAPEATDTYINVDGFEIAGLLK
jgi:hypothetical protein